MTSTMTTPTNLGEPDWQPPRVPRLAYRNPLPPGEKPLQRAASTASTSQKKPERPTLSTHEMLTQLSPQISPIPSAPQSPSSFTQEQKSKRSKFKGLFASEPSTMAFNQYKQQMLTNHGCLSPKVVPGVSSAKMPVHVPKVNTKWDGVPDHIKLKEKEEKGKTKLGRSESLYMKSPQSHSLDCPDYQSVIRRRNSKAGSITESWDSRSTGSRPVFQDNDPMRPESIYSTSSGSSAYPAQRPISGISHPYGSSSGTRTPDTSLYCLEETPTPPKGPQRLLSSQSTSTESTDSYGQLGTDHSPLIQASPVDVMLECTSSSATTPLERSPQTPTPLSEDDMSFDKSLLVEGICLVSATVAAPVDTSKPNRGSTHRSMSTSKKRTGLGLHTHNAITPWETQVLPSEIVSSPQIESPTKSRSRLRLFGKEKK